MLFYANFLIALREGVEAALIVGVVIAYLVKVNRRELIGKVWLGVAIAAAIPLAMGAYMTWGPYTLSFTAQEVIGGTLSLVAVAMVTWMILWMGKNSRKFAAELQSKTAAALESGSRWGVVWIALIAVAREGIETAVFVWATVKSSTETSVASPALGVVAGLAVSVVIGWLVYTGAARINLKVFFRVTGLLLIFVAAGIVSYGLGDLQEANVISGWGVPAYDFSAYVNGSVFSWLDSRSWWWVLLEAMFNLNAAPTHLQVIGYLSYLAIVLPIFLVGSGMVTRRAAKDSSKSDAALPAAPTAGLASSGATSKTSADATSNGAAEDGAIVGTAGGAANTSLSASLTPSTASLTSTTSTDSTGKHASNDAPAAESA